MSIVIVMSCLAMLASINCQQIVSREEWGARPPKATANITIPVSRVFIHHGAGSETPCTTQEQCTRIWKGYQDLHMDTNGWNDIGYNWGVGEDGRVYEGRNWFREGAHTQGYNSISVAICIMGNFMNRPPAQIALDAAQQMIANGVREGWITSSYTLGGHRNAGNTLCPGDKLYEIIKTWPNFGY